MGDPRYLHTLAFDHLDHAISRKTARRRDGDRSQAGLTRLAGPCLPTVEGGRIDLDMDDRLGCDPTSGEGHERVRRVRFGRLVLTGALGLLLKSRRVGLDDGQQASSVVRCKPCVQSNRTIALDPVTQIPPTADALGHVLVTGRRRPHLATLLPQRRQRLLLSQRQQRWL